MQYINAAMGYLWKLTETLLMKLSVNYHYCQYWMYVKRALRNIFLFVFAGQPGLDSGAGTM